MIYQCYKSSRWDTGEKSDNTVCLTFIFFTLQRADESSFSFLKRIKGDKYKGRTSSISQRTAENLS